MDNACVKKLLNLLENEIEKHKNSSKKTIWDRGFEDGRITEALTLRTKVRKILSEFGYIKNKKTA